MTMMQMQMMQMILVLVERREGICGVISNRAPVDYTVD